MNEREKHVLVAEDEALLLEMIRKILVKHGIRVSTAIDGLQAIAILDKDPPDLLLLDLLMPHVDGFAVLQHRKDKKMKFPVFVCTNLSDKKTIIKCNEFGVNEYLIKSDMDDDHIWNAVEKYLS